ncbi:MAG: DUF1700 domain-containing protein [Lachnospiraceae bacterium]|nr:DUF1700 domain-containing protein [Lachnospiraceae bacterium]
MNREQFLSELRQALSGSISPSSVNENIRFYEEYLDTEIRKGRTEEEVLSELGDPRLIARTIIDTSDTSVKRGSERIYDADREAAGEEDGRGRSYGNIKYTRISGAKALLILALILIIFFVIFTLAVWLVGSFILAFWPAILGAAVLWWILNPLKGD